MPSKKHPCENREQDILFALIDLYLLTGKPIGSNTLKESRCGHISSATIRKYLAKLEARGLLKQQHLSGGRVPTASAYKCYAAYHASCKEVDPKDLEIIRRELNKDTKEIANYLQNASEILSDLAQGAVFLSSPRFDQDLIVDIKLIHIDIKRYLCVLMTDFGLIHTEILYTTNMPKKLSTFSLKRIESYFHFRMTGLNRPKLNREEEDLAAQFYNEILLRHIVNYSNFSSEDIYKTGFSKLIRFPEFRDATVLATGLAIFENTEYVRALLQECVQAGDLKFWIGNELNHACAATSHSAVVAMPYSIHEKPVGAIALLGSIRMFYPKIFGIIRNVSEVVSKTVTRNLYKYKLTYRRPTKQQIGMQTNFSQTLTQAQKLQLEDKSEDING